MSEPVKIAIVLEGGLVSAVLSAGVPVEYVTIDYDTDGAAPSELVPVPQSNGPDVLAWVSLHPDRADNEGKFVLAAHQRFAGAATIFVNHYECEQCGSCWDDTWSAACNDRCPHCDAETEPCESHPSSA